MVRAVRSVSVEKGYDVREFSLMAFGGAGPLHACEVAKELGMKRVIIPPNPGTLCSLGLLLADTRFDMSRTAIVEGKPESLSVVNEMFDQMIGQGTEALEREGVPEERRSFEFSIDIRYLRQNFEINIPVAAGRVDEDMLRDAISAFHAEHKRSYGYCNEKAVVQFVSYRVTAVGTIDKPEFKEKPLQKNAPMPKVTEIRNVLFQGEKEHIKTPVMNRMDLVAGQKIAGPCILEQMDSTIVIPKHWVIHVDGYDNLLVDYSEE